MAIAAKDTGLRPDRVTLGIALMVGFTICAPMIDTFAKLSSAYVVVAQIVAARFVIQATLLMPMSGVFGWAHRPAGREVALQFARAALILIATGFFVAALAVMPLADAVAIFFVEPFILILLGAAFLREPVGWQRLVLCLIGLGGALLVIQPNFAALGPAAFLPLGTAVTFACYMLLTRAMARRMHPVTLQAYTAVAASLLILPLLAAGHGMGVEALTVRWPDPMVYWLLLGVGVASTVAHIFVSFALSMAPAGIIAPIQYLEIVAAAVLGYWIFDDLPDPWAMTGIVIIMVSGIGIYARERAIERRLLLGESARQSPRGSTG
ncbi:MAG: DMT family transporter [Spiribacter salinus]|uniref:DMT family transporter n=1 Tax=Spiribacter salinus TaxID=1335746 RepID=A0A540VSU5_9GAMM|nr:MAG: DMT family transporter [Spiribacter salinus]